MIKLYSLLFTCCLLASSIFSSVQAVTAEAGDLKSYLKQINYGHTGDNRWLEPDDLRMGQFKAVFEHFLAGSYDAAAKGAEVLGYEVVEYTDLASGVVHYLLRETSPADGILFTGGGTYVLTPTGSNVVLQVPHPKFDSKTVDQGIETYLAVDARLLMMAGTRRDSSTTQSPCTDGRYAASDVAHQTQSLFYAAHQVAADADSATVFVQFHGFGRSTLSKLKTQCGSSNNKLINLSEGIGHATDPDEMSLMQILQRKVRAGGIIDACVYGNDTSSLGGTWNVQGRYTNSSVDACVSNANVSSKRFLHLEQSHDVRFRHRGDMSDYLGQALDEYLLLANAVPVFPQGGGDYAIEEHALVGSSLGFIKALDANANDLLNYSIADGNTSFALDSVSGELTLAANLNRATDVKHELLIEVTDGKAKIQTSVAIYIIRAEDIGKRGLLLQRWTGISGSAVSDLIAHPNFPARPYQSRILDVSETSGLGGDGGQRLSGFLRVPKSGEYTFWLASGGTSELRLSGNTEQNSGDAPMAWIEGGTGFQQWSEYASQKSMPVYLVAGRLYNLEALHKAGREGGHISVALQKTGDLNPTVMDAHYLIPRNVIDGVAPLAPMELSSDEITFSSVQLSWSAGSDEVGISRYELYRDGVRVASLSSVEHIFRDVGLVENTQYQYALVVEDVFGNRSTAIELIVQTRLFSRPVEVAS